MTADLTEDDVHQLRQQGDLQAALAARRDALRADMKTRRALVLRHPDIAARLTEPPLALSRPDTWTGYLPPSTWGGAVNDSPIREQLVNILTAAEEATP